ncbi:hypothetical protein ACQEU3_46870 [Spirillospora sp. CA-253888]
MTAQAQDSITMSALGDWGSRAVVEADEVGMALSQVKLYESRRTWPPCPGCGAEVNDYLNPITFNFAAKTITFKPCGCVLAVPDMPKWSQA